MASVRMTNDLRETIYQKALEAFHTARPEPQPSTWLTDRVRDAVLSSGPYKALKEAFDRQHGTDFKSFGGPVKAITKEDCTRIVLNSRNGFHKGTTQNLVFSFVPGFSLYRQNSWGTPELMFEELGAQVQSELVGPCREVAEEIQKFHQSRNDYQTKIRDLLAQCTTVKQMLLAWPAGESFVPHESKTRMYEKVTRIQRAQQIKEEVQFDDSLVNEVVLTAKLVGG